MTYTDSVSLLIQQYEFYISNLNRCISDQKRNNPKDVLGIEIWESSARTYTRVIEDLRKLGEKRN